MLQGEFYLYLLHNRLDICEEKKRADYMVLTGERERERDLLSTAAGLCGPGSVVGIAIGYGLDGPGIESRWGRDFPRLSRPALGPTQPPVE